MTSTTEKAAEKVNYELCGTMRHPDDSPSGEQIFKLQREVVRLRNELFKLRNDIIEYSHDTVWVGASETACERITSILGDAWGADGNCEALKGEQV